MKRLDQLTQLTAAQLAQDDIIGIRDQSAGQTKYITVKDLTGSPDLGWQATAESWAYSSWNATTRIGVVTVPSDATTKYTVKNRVRFSQTTGGTKYAIIVAITATTLTLHFPTGVTLNNEAITSPVYSPLDSPIGFPTTKTSWRFYVQLSTTTGGTTNGNWQNTGGIQLTLGPGDYQINGLAGFQKSAGIEMYTAISNSTGGAGAASYPEMSIREYRTGTGLPWLNSHRHRLDSLVLTAASTILYMNYCSGSTGEGYDARGDTSGPHLSCIEAITNYL